MSHSDKHWATVEERGSIIGMKILFFVYKLLGRKVLWVPLFPVILYLFLSGKTARKASKQFLKRVHEFQSTDKKITLWMSLKHFCAFADSAFDKIDAWLGKITLDHVRYGGDSQFSDIAKLPQGAIFIGSHLGNLEVCRALSHGRYSTVINVLVFTKNAVKFNDILSNVNDEVSVNLIQVTDIGPALAISLKEKIDNGEMLVIVGDRTSVTTSGRVMYSPFLGENAPFSQGPFILASILECPVYWLFCLKEQDNYNVIFEHVTDRLDIPRKYRQQQLQELIDSYAQRLSYYASRYPYQWFNFYDFWQRDEQVSR